MTKPQSVTESQGYKFIEQTIIISKRVFLSLFLQVLKEEVQTISARCHIAIIPARHKDVPIYLKGKSERG